MRDVELHELSFGKRTFQVVAQNLQFVWAIEIRTSAEVVGHDESTAPNILPEIRDLIVIENYKTRLRQIEERILEDFRTAELHDLVRVGPDADARQLMNECDEKFIRLRVIVLPGGHIGPVGGPVHP